MQTLQSLANSLGVKLQTNVYGEITIDCFMEGKNWYYVCRPSGAFTLKDEEVENITNFFNKHI